MLTIKQIKGQTEDVIRRLQKKHFDAREYIAELLELDEKRRTNQQEIEKKNAEQKGLSTVVLMHMHNDELEEAETVRNWATSLRETCRQLAEEKKEAEARIREILLQIPNLPAEIVPEGATAEDNVCVKKGYGARLQRALINFFLDNAREAGFTEVQPPYVVNEDSGYGTGQLPDKEGQMYHVGVDNLYLIPTAEVPVTNIYRDVILDEKDLPVRNTAYSACFRREAGSYGKDVRGLNRLHQFDKVEIVCIDKPERSYERLDEMVAYVETLVTKLELPWRILRLSGGDMSFTSALTYDFEVFSAAQQRWLEVSSVSNFESYQANRLRLRYRDSEQGVQLAHTLNGSALALPRIVAALLENNQTPEGIRIPEALRPYTGFDLIPLPQK